MGRRVGRGLRPLVPRVAGHMNKSWLNAIRCKRSRSTGVWKWGFRVFVPCPAGVKAATCAAARLANMSEAEFALRILQAALADEAWLASALRDDSRQVAPSPAEHGGEDGDAN